MPDRKSSPDTRMAEREKRRQGSTTASAPDPSSLEDLAPNVAVPTEEDLEKLRADLLAEGEVRDRRIERFVREGPLKPIRAPWSQSRRTTSRPETAP
jgi:hypothetical protein